MQQQQDQLFNLPNSTWRLLALVGSTLLCGTFLLDFAYQAVISTDLPKNMAFMSNMFDLDGEANLPAWFGSICWFLVGATAFCSFLVDKEKKERWSLAWIAFAVMFFLASADEIAELHENLGMLLQQLPQSSSAIPVPVHWLQLHQTAPHSPWIIFLAPLILIFCIFMVLFLWKRFSELPVLTVMVLLAVDCYALAIAMDHFQGLPREQIIAVCAHANIHPIHLLRASVLAEESLENVGSIFLILAFGGYAHRKWLLGRSAGEVCSPRTTEITE